MADVQIGKVELEPPAAPAQGATELVRSRYDRIAPIYDAMEWMMELGARRWRRELWAEVPPGRVLEVGVGTGKNFRFYPPAAQVRAIDLSPRMLARARRRAERLGTRVELEIADAQQLPYPDRSFDTAVSTFVFCSVPDPVQALRELTRVVKPGGRVLLLEHVLSERRFLRRIMQWMDPLPARLWGAHINRDTVANVRAAGFQELTVKNLSLDVVKRIEALLP